MFLKRSTKDMYFERDPGRCCSSSFLIPIHIEYARVSYIFVDTSMRKKPPGTEYSSASWQAGRQAGKRASFLKLISCSSSPPWLSDCHELQKGSYVELYCCRSFILHFCVVATSLLLVITRSNKWVNFLNLFLAEIFKKLCRHQILFHD